MKVVTHTFNVGDANFIVSHSNGILLIEDAGIGPGISNKSSYKFKKMDPTKPQTELNEIPGEGLTAFKNILRNNEITTVHTFITHQHKDHMNLLPNLFKVIRLENARRSFDLSAGALKPIKIGKFYVGGTRRENKDADIYLKRVSQEVGNITATFIGNIPYREESFPGDPQNERDHVSRQEYDYTLEPNYRDYGHRLFKGMPKITERIPTRTLNIPPANRKGRDYIRNFEESFPLRFGSNTDSPIFSILFPQSFDTPIINKENISNMNDINLIGRLEMGSKRGLFSGDATTKVQRDIKEKYGCIPVFSDASFATIPHHLSKTGGQAEKFAETIRIKTLRTIGDITLDALGSTSRNDNKFPDRFKGDGDFPASDIERGINLYKTRTLQGNEVFTTILNKNGAKTTIENFSNLSSSRSSQNSIGAMEKEIESNSNISTPFRNPVALFGSSSFSSNSSGSASTPSSPSYGIIYPTVGPLAGGPLGNLKNSPDSLNHYPSSPELSKRKRKRENDNINGINEVEDDFNLDSNSSFSAGSSSRSAVIRGQSSSSSEKKRFRTDFNALEPLSLSNSSSDSSSQFSVSSSSKSAIQSKLSSSSFAAYVSGNKKVTRRIGLTRAGSSSDSNSPSSVSSNSRPAVVLSSSSSSSPTPNVSSSSFSSNSSGSSSSFSSVPSVIPFPVTNFPLCPAWSLITSVHKK